MATTIPETVFIMFQMTFAIITPALITGAFADRMQFSALVMFNILWSLLVYAPVAHWVWHPNGWIFALGALDFAGGTVVHINAGVAGLVCAVVLGKRVGYGNDNMAPYNLSLAVIGAALLWVGWFGFNAGSAGGAGRARRHGHAGDADRRGRRGARLDVRGVGHQGEAQRARRHLRRGRRPRRHHPGLGLRAAGAGAADRRGGRRRGLLGRDRAEAHVRL